jgi:hypothetical protein
MRYGLHPKRASWYAMSDPTGPPPTLQKLQFQRRSFGIMVLLTLQHRLSVGTSFWIENAA